MKKKYEFAGCVDHSVISTLEDPDPRDPESTDFLCLNAIADYEYNLLEEKNVLI